MKTNTLLSITGAAALALVACGGDDTSASTSTTASSSASTMDSASSGGQGGSSSGQGGDATTTTSTTSGGQGGAGGDASTSSTSGGQGGAGGGGNQDPLINGCTRATATDMTNSKSVELPAWTFGHKACFILTPGTQVNWKGDFSAHPLKGGVAPTVDATSPIGKAMVNATTATVVLPTEQGKAYPYFCGIHTAMQGVVYTAE
ncbi:MAG: hypothetical protein FJ096_08605 [Deltaproteobacteria bacterium]|nr:hypothetical protein [Deltaproteobacteria bacterium]